MGEEEKDRPEIPASDELEEALREASEAIDEREKAAAAREDESVAATPDKLTIELLSQELQSLKEAFEARGNELEEATDRHLRLQAEFENFRRRSLRERQETLQYGHQNFVKDLLSSVDNLDRALEHADSSANADLQSVLQGVELVRKELLGALGKYGVTTIDAEGQPFDPTYHEAIGQLADDSVEPNTVVQVLQKGYMLRDRMLRPARVLVARAAIEGEKAGKAEAEPAEESEKAGKAGAEPAEESEKAT